MSKVGLGFVLFFYFDYEDMCQPLFNTCISNVQISFFFLLSLIYESLLLITLVIRSFVSSKVEYCNAEEVAIRNIVFPGKISQGS